MCQWITKSIKVMREKRGQTVVELALILPIFLLLLFSMIEFGRVLYIMQMMQFASREGARVGVVNTSDTVVVEKIVNNLSGYMGAGCTVAYSSGTDEQGRNMVIATISSLNAGIDNVIVKISPDAVTRQTGDDLMVRINHSLDIFSPLMEQILPNPYPIDALIYMKVE